MSPWDLLLLGATGVHAGFQAAVTVLVYPALARVRVEDWSSAHDAHSRRITPLVAVVYGVVVLSCVAAVQHAPSSPGVAVAALGTAGAVLVTATTAAPTHARLGRGRTTALVSRLLVVDRLRLAFALLAFLGAILAGAAAA